MKCQKQSYGNDPGERMELEKNEMSLTFRGFDHPDKPGKRLRNCGLRPGSKVILKQRSVFIIRVDGLVAGSDLQV